MILYRSMSTAIRDDDNVNHTFDLTKYTAAVTCTLFLPYGRTSCDYIGDVMSWFYDPSSEDSYQTGHSLSFSVWSESSLSAWRNLRSLPTHSEISRSFSANFRGVSPQNFAEKTLGEISDFYFPPRKKLFRARSVLRRKVKQELFFWSDLYRN